LPYSRGSPWPPEWVHRDDWVTRRYGGYGGSDGSVSHLYHV
jgi:hypothetical protein